MIPRISRGRSAYGALSYDHGPGRVDEHRNAHKVAGNVAGRSWKQRSVVIDEHVRRLHPKLTNPIIRTSLRVAPEDRPLNDREWRSIATEYVQRMGFGAAPWEAVRHADDHIHLTMSRVNWDGTVVDQWRDKTRAQSVVRDIEHRHDLLDASSRYNRDAPAVSRNDRERVARAGRSNQRQPEKVTLREKIDAALAGCTGSRESFEAELRREGVQFRANVSASTERHPQGLMNGYSYGLVGHVDTTGEEVWFKGSKLGQRYSWTRTDAALRDRRIEHERAAGNETAGRDPDQFGGKGLHSDSEAVSRQPGGAPPASPAVRGDDREQLRRRYEESRMIRKPVADDSEDRDGLRERYRRQRGQSPPRDDQDRQRGRTR